MDRKHFQFPTADVEKRKSKVEFFYFMPRQKIVFALGKFRSIFIDLRADASFAHGSEALSIAYCGCKKKQLKSRIFFIFAMAFFFHRNLPRW